MEYRTLSEEYLEIGERIRKRRLELHLSQEQLAERAGISVNTLSRLENGQSSTTIEKFRRILLALDADANYLIGMEVSKVKEAGGDKHEIPQIWGEGRKNPPHGAGIKLQQKHIVWTGEIMAI